MRRLPHCFWVSFTCLSVLWTGGSGALRAADDDTKPEGKRVHFSTVDEVELTGTLYRAAPTAGNKDKDAVVLLLHDFRGPKGGGSHQDGWNHLAGELQKAGYSVLSFDFRGFGDSTSVSPKFWKYAHNSRLPGAGRAKNPSTIDQKNFPSFYYISLLNDIAAARTYLNVLNDAGDVNSSNILVVGAGQGATLGALWMATECRRQRDNQSDRLLPTMNPQLRALDDPEGNDLSAAVWLTISPELERRTLGTAVKTALVDTARNARIPTYFLYGATDENAAKLAANYLSAINNETGRKIETKTEAKANTKGVRAKAIPGSKDLAGSVLLRPQLKTTKEIVDFLNRIIDDRGTRVRKERQESKYAFCWTLPWPSARNIHARPLAKMPGEPMMRVIPPQVLSTIGVR
jgi:alpha-beta hydrolase superfamily lysophospholipase